MTSQIVGEEELVEGIIENVQQTTSTSDFVNENGVPVGIDVAIIRCIERYGQYLCLSNVDIFAFIERFESCEICCKFYRYGRIETQILLFHIISGRRIKVSRYCPVSGGQIETFIILS